MKKKLIICMVIAILLFSGMQYLLSRIENKDTTPEAVSVLEERQEEVTVLNDIAYDETKESCTLDIAYKDDIDRQPLIVCVHGGSWIGGDKQEMNNIMYSFSDMGYVVASVNYQLWPDMYMLGQAQQVGDAVSYLIRNSEKYHIDKDRIVLLGFSAGAQLALRCGELAVAGETKDPFSPVALVDISGPADLEYILYYSSEDADVKNIINHPEYLTGVMNSDVTIEAKKADVLNNISSDLPPVLIIHGQDDQRVPMMHSKKLYEGLTQLGVKAELVEIKGMGHELNCDLFFPYLNKFLKENV